LAAALVWGSLAPRRTAAKIRVPVVADPIIAIDFGQTLRVWDGFGVNYVEAAQSRDYAAWPQEYGGFSVLSEADRERVLDMIFGPRGLKPAITKMFLDCFHEGMTRTGNDNDDPHDLNMAGFDHTATTKWMRYFNREGLARTRAWGGDLTILATLYGPAPWMTKQKFVLGRDIDPAEKAELVEYMVSWVKYLREEERLPVRFLSFHNEGCAYYRWPRDGSNPGEDHRDYNMLWPPEQVAEFLRRTRPVLDRYGLHDVGLTPGETQTWYRFDEWGYARAICTDASALRNLALVTSHSFANYKDLQSVYYGDWRSNGIDLLRSAKPDLHAWVTSMSWGSMDAVFVENVRRNIYLSKVNAVTPWAVIQRRSQWVGGDPNPKSAFHVTDDGELLVLPGYHYYKQLTRAGQPGMAVAAVTAYDPSVTAVAFARNGTDNPDAFIIINHSDDDKDVHVTVRGTAAREFRLYRTSPNDENYKFLGRRKLGSGRRLACEAPEGSVTTFYAVVD
jgi:hypothetical protein